MAKVSIHPPKTPVTKGSNGVAKASLPNVCKMPAPPAPFQPSPLPNTGKSGLSPQGYSTTVEIEGNAVAIGGATFESMGDMASKATGGGLISANTQGPTKFVTTGSMTVQVEGKNVHRLGEPMLNNCGASGSPPNTGSTTPGEDQADSKPKPFEIDLNCEERLASGDEEEKCKIEEMCAMIKAYNESKLPKKKVSPSPSRHINRKSRERIKQKYGIDDAAIDALNAKNNRYGNGLKKWARGFAKKVRANEKNPAWKDSKECKDQFVAECRHKKWKADKAPAKPPQGTDKPNGMSPDHVHDVGQGGPCEYAEMKDGL